MTTLVLEIDTNKVWKCIFCPDEDLGAYRRESNECILRGVGSCSGDLVLRPANCPLTEYSSEQKFEDFRAGIKNYLDLTDKLVDTIRAGHEDLANRLCDVIKMVVAVNDKVNCLAAREGFITPEEISSSKVEKH